jgi:hypothetical protein
MTDANSAIADYDSVNSYNAEAGETKAHIYHWLKTFEKLGHLKTGTGALTADYPAAMAFEKNDVMTYVIYNYTDEVLDVNYSDGQKVTSTSKGFTILTR